MGQVRLQGRPLGRSRFTGRARVQLGVPLLTTPSQQTNPQNKHRLRCPGRGEHQLKQSCGSRQAPGIAQAPESSGEEGHGGSMPQNSPWLTQHHENTELKTSWTARRSSQSILKEINPESLQGLMLKLKLQYFGHLM